MTKSEQYIADKITEFKKKSKSDYKAEDTLLINKNGFPVEYPESEYELDIKAVESFLSQSLHELEEINREEYKQSYIDFCKEYNVPIETAFLVKINQLTKEGK